MRGKVLVNGSNIDEDRITPAYAGKSNSKELSKLAWKDHPRLCGEKIFSDILHGYSIGSPPPMRGKGKVCCLKNSCNGITPAYAGKSCGNSG